MTEKAGCLKRASARRVITHIYKVVVRALMLVLLLHFCCVIRNYGEFARVWMCAYVLVAPSPLSPIKALHFTACVACIYIHTTVRSHTNSIYRMNLYETYSVACVLAGFSYIKMGLSLGEVSRTTAKIRLECIFPFTRI